MGLQDARQLHRGLHLLGDCHGLVGIGTYSLSEVCLLSLSRRLGFDSEVYTMKSCRKG